MATLGALDYFIIVAMLIASALIGVFFAVRSRRNQSASNYFLGDRHMAMLPVAVSISATFISAITYLGTPAEVYIHGPKYALMSSLRSFVPLVIAYCFIPVFYRLEITTVYEYLEMRFNNTVRFLVVAAEFFGLFTYIGIVVYAPALALSTVTGLNLNFSILAIGVICTFYTSIGGIKAVIWTDVFQACVMVVGATIMIIAGTVSFGGPSEGWRRAAEGERTHLVDFNIDPTVRLTFWTIMIGGSSFLIMITGTKQTFVQRYLACRSERDAQMAAWVGLCGTAVMELLAVATGMTVFAYYYTCDPLTSGNISRPDQIVPYFMIDFFQSVPGVPGLLISGAFCASLSSMSSVLNAAASMAGHDIVKTIWPEMTNTKYSMVVKIISAVFGLITIALAFLASVLGDVLETALSLAGVTGGPVLGIFLLALFVPRGNSKGALIGIIGGTLLGLYIYIGSRFYPPISNRPPLSIEGCEALVNETTSVGFDDLYTESYTIMDNYLTGEDESSSEPVRPPGTGIYRISYLYLTTIPALLSFLLGVVVSYLSSWNDLKTADAKLVAPIVARFCTSEEEHVENIKPIPSTGEYVALRKV